MNVFIILAIAITVVYMIYYPVMIYLDLTKRAGTKKSSVEEIGVEGAAEDNNDTFVVRESEDGSFETVQLSSSAEGEERDLENSSELPESETAWINGGEDVPSETNVEDAAETGENFYGSSDDDVYSGTEETSTEENNPDEQEDDKRRRKWRKQLIVLPQIGELGNIPAGPVEPLPVRPLVQIEEMLEEARHAAADVIEGQNAAGAVQTVLGSFLQHAEQPRFVPRRHEAADIVESLLKVSEIHRLIELLIEADDVHFAVMHGVDCRGA